MKIASRASSHYRQEFRDIECERHLSDSDSHVIMTVRNDRQPDPSDPDDGCAVIFNCGKPGNTLTAGIEYDFYVRLSAYELLSALASLPLPIVEAAAGRLLSASQLEREKIVQAEEWGQLANAKSWGFPTAIQLQEISNAVSRGIISSLTAIERAGDASVVS